MSPTVQIKRVPFREISLARPSLLYFEINTVSTLVLSLAILIRYWNHHGIGCTVILNGFEHMDVNRCVNVGCMKTFIVTVRYVLKVEFGPLATGRIMIDDIEQC